MRVEIDQSGKIEQTNKPTVVAFSNDQDGSLVLPAKEKHRLQMIFRQAGKPRMFIIQTFSILLYLLLERVIRSNVILVIDKEYPAYEHLIKGYILQLVRKRKKIEFHPENIEFARIGKKSHAHKLANRVFNLKKGVRIKAEDVLSLVLILEH